jgi:hypothetical protein
VRDQVFRIQVHQQHLPVLTLVQVVVVLVQVLVIQHSEVVVVDLDLFLSLIHPDK